MTLTLTDFDDLTTEEIKQVKNFAKFLVARRAEEANDRAAGTEKIQFDGWVGCMAGIEPEKSSKQLIREAWDAVVDKIDRAGQ